MLTIRHIALLITLMPYVILAQEKSINQAIQLINNQQFDRAITVLQRVTQRNPDHASAYYYLGVIAGLKDLPDETISHYRKTVALDPDHYEARYSLAMLLFEQEKYEEAIEHLMVIAENNEFGSTKTVFYELSPFTQRTNQVRTMETIKPTVYNHLAMSFVAIDRLQQGLKYYNLAIEAYPEYAATYVNRGMLYLNKGDTSLAITDFEKALHMDSTTAYARYNLAIARGEAIDTYTDAMVDNPNALANQAYRYFVEKDFTKALEYYTKAIALDNSNSALYTDRGLTQLKLKAYDMAVKDFHRARKLNDADTNTLFHLGNGYFKTKDFNKAADYYLLFLEKVPDGERTKKAYYNLGLSQIFTHAINQGCLSLKQSIDRGFKPAAKPYEVYCQ